MPTPLPLFRTNIDGTFGALAAEIPPCQSSEGEKYEFLVDGEAYTHICSRGIGLTLCEFW